jgi:hypothetical protein
MEDRDSFYCAKYQLTKLPTYQALIGSFQPPRRLISASDSSTAAGQFTDPLQPKMGCLHQLYLVYTFRPKHFEDR